MEEKTIFDGSPSQWVNLPHYLISLILLPFYGISLFYMFYRFLAVKYWNINITTQRIVEETGILSKNTNELELYRVKDVKLVQPLLLRIVGLSNLVLTTSDKTHPTKVIPGVKNGKELREELRNSVERRREEKGVREVDFR